MNNEEITQLEKLAYSVQEAALASSMSVPYLRNKIRDKELPAYNQGRRVIILREDLVNFLRSGAVAA